MDFLNKHCDTEGPVGLPMKDAQAHALYAILKDHPGHKPKFIVTAKAPSKLLPGERAGVSWISTEDVYRDTRSPRSSETAPTATKIETSAIGSSPSDATTPALTARMDAWERTVLQPVFDTKPGHLFEVSQIAG